MMSTPPIVTDDELVTQINQSLPLNLHRAQPFTDGDLYAMVYASQQGKGAWIRVPSQDSMRAARLPVQAVRDEGIFTRLPLYADVNAQPITVSEVEGMVRAIQSCNRPELASIMNTVGSRMALRPSQYALVAVDTTLHTSAGMITRDSIPLQNPDQYGRIIQDIANANPESGTWFVNPEDFTDGTYNQEDWQRFTADIEHLRDIYGSRIDDLVEVAPSPTEPINDDYIAVMFGDFQMLFHEDPFEQDEDEEEEDDEYGMDTLSDLTMNTVPDMHHLSR